MIATQLQTLFEINDIKCDFFEKCLYIAHINKASEKEAKRKNVMRMNDRSSQVINVCFLQFLLEENMHRQGRMYLYLRDKASNSAGWFDYNSKLLTTGALHFGVSVSTFRRHLKKLMDIGWVVRDGDKARFIGLNRIMHARSLRGAWSVDVTFEDLTSTLKDWKAFIYSAVVSNEIAAMDFRRKNGTYFSIKDKTRVKRKELTINTVNDSSKISRSCGQWAHTLSNKEFGISMAESSRLQLRAYERGYLDREAVFDPAVDALNLNTMERLFHFLRNSHDERYQLWMFRFYTNTQTYRYLDGLRLTMNISVRKRKRLGKGLKYLTKSVVSKLSVKIETLSEANEGADLEALLGYSG